MKLFALLLSLTLFCYITTLKSDLRIWLESNSNVLRNSEFQELIRRSFKQVICTTNTDLFSKFQSRLKEKSLSFEENVSMFYIGSLWNKMIKSQLLEKKLQHQLDKNMKSYNICRRIISTIRNSALDLSQGKSEKNKILNNDTLSEHPYLIQNTKSEELTFLLNIIPSQILSNLGVRRYVISDQMLYQANYSPLQKSSFTKLLSSVLNKLPDMDFVIFGQNVITQQIIHNHLLKMNLTFLQYDTQFEVYKQALIKLPGFMWSKDLNSDLQNNKLLIPGNLQNVITALSKNVERSEAVTKNKITSIFSFDTNCIRSIHSSANPPQANLISQKQTICKFHQKLQMQNLLKQYVKTQPKDKNIKYLIRTEENNNLQYSISWSSNDHNLLLKQQNKIVQWYYDEIKPNVHYVPIKEDLSDLLQKYTVLVKDHQLLNNITTSSYIFSKFRFTPQRIKADFIKTLIQYAKIQNESGGSYKSVTLSGASLVNIGAYLQNDKKSDYFQSYFILQVEILYLAIAIVLILLVILIGLYKLMKLKLQNKLTNFQLIFSIAKTSHNLGKRISNQLLSI